MISNTLPATGLWTVHVDSGVATRVIPGRPLRITGVALGYVVINQHQRTSLQLTFQPEGTEETLKPTICSLVAGKIEHASCDLFLEADREFIFDVFGENSVDIVGNYVEFEDDDDEDIPTTVIEFHGRKDIMSHHNIAFTAKAKAPNGEDHDNASSVGSGPSGKRKATKKNSITTQRPSKKAKSESK